MMEIPVSLLAWKPIRKNSLRGFASVRLGKSLVINDITVHVSHGRRWASLPAKPILGQNGEALRDDAGKIKYSPILQWNNRESADAFSKDVIAAVEREHPGEADE